MPLSGATILESSTRSCLNPCVIALNTIPCGWAPKEHDLVEDSKIVAPKSKNTRRNCFSEDSKAVAQQPRIRIRHRYLELPNHANHQTHYRGSLRECGWLAAVDRFEADSPRFSVIAFDDRLSFTIDREHQVSIAAIGLAADHQVVAFHH